MIPSGMAVVGAEPRISPVWVSTVAISPKSRTGRVQPAAGQTWSSQSKYPSPARVSAVSVATSGGV
jgi:hypothetical protein